jgi:glycosyltransferase involved in cell wall biosynthesis
VLRALRPDIVDAHTPKAGLLGTLAARILGVPVVIYHLHGSPLTTARGLRRRVLAATERIACRAATRVVAVGDSLRDMVIEAGVVPADKITVLLDGSINGVDARGRFDPDQLEGDAGLRVRRANGIPDDALVFAFVGRLVHDKGVDVLVEAWDRVASELPSARLLVVGDFEERDPVSPETVRTIAEDGTIVRVGFVEDVASIYAAADVVVLPTHREGFPNVPLEAAAMGLPVVSTRAVGAADAVIDGLTGTLVDVGDSAELARAMVSYGRDSQLRERHGSAGRAHVREHHVPERLWRATADLYLELLRESLGAGEAAPSRRRPRRAPLGASP